MRIELAVNTLQIRKIFFFPFNSIEINVDEWRTEQRERMVISNNMQAFLFFCRVLDYRAR